MRLAASILLFVQGGMTLLVSLFLAFAAVVGPFVIIAEGPQPGDPPPIFMALFYGSVALVCLVLAFVQTLGGYSALKTRSWGLALAGGIASILSGMMCCNLVGLGLGIAATVLLVLPDVQAEFREARPEI